MRADRLISILLLLQNQKQMTSKQLADKLEVSERTVHRDMEALSAAGIPVYSERGSQGGWRLTEGYRTNLTGLKSEELSSLLLAGSIHLLRDLGKQADYEAAYQKIWAAMPDTLKHDAEFTRQRIHIDGAGWHETLETSTCLPTIQEAVWAERKLAITYERGVELVERVIQPLGLVAKRSTWYVVAETEGDLRTYRVSRIHSAAMTDEAFRRPEPFDLASYWKQSMERFTADLPKYPATIGLKQTALQRIRQERYVKIIATAPWKREGWTEAEAEFNTLESACEICLAFGPELIVLAPAELRERVLGQAAAIVNLYEGERLD
ncbi:YafY family transcriptional regulator [Paenibacillus mesophilus]|uniref:helix-turn-helix transcriptional regulator n=1 Tax=Paenibacillus mesophilus TaxID=2582849 RepID=UPI00110D9330|nr:YafY family protein [Paenibacillus mesophilus]TMV49665.1 YafY family transcriptional regulator [Paenibacillus mesophilus]